MSFNKIIAAAALMAFTAAVATPAQARTWYWCGGIASGDGTTKWMYTYPVERSAAYGLQALAQEFQQYMARYGWTIASPTCHRTGDADDDYDANREAERDAQNQAQAQGLQTSKVILANPQ